MEAFREGPNSQFIPLWREAVKVHPHAHPPPNKSSATHIPPPLLHPAQNLSSARRSPIVTVIASVLMVIASVVLIVLMLAPIVVMVVSVVVLLDRAS